MMMKLYICIANFFNSIPQQRMFENRFFNNDQSIFLHNNNKKYIEFLNVGYTVKGYQIFLDNYRILCASFFVDLID